MRSDVRRMGAATGMWLGALLVAAASAAGQTPGRGAAGAGGRGSVTAPASRPTGRGSVGLGTYATIVQFKDLLVTAPDPDGKTLFKADLSKGLNDWYFHGGQWKVVDDYLKQSTIDRDCWATFGQTAWTDYTLSVKARKIAGDEGFAVLFRVRDHSNYCWFNVGGWKNTKAQVETSIGGTRTPIGSFAPLTVEPNRWYDVKVEVRGETAKCYVDGALLCITDISEVPAASPANAAPARGNPSPAPTARGNSAAPTAATRTAPPATTQPAVSNANRLNTLRQQLQNPNKSQITKGFADFKAWYAVDPINAEHGFWQVRALLPPLTKYVNDTMDMIALAWAAKNRPDGDHGDPGYLYALEASCLFQLHKPEEALAKLRDGLQMDPVHASEEFVAYIAKAVPPQEADSALVDILPAVAAGKAEDTAVAEGALKIRIAALNRLRRYPEALADARSFFNVCAMRHTAEALTLLDQQLRLAHPGDAALDDLFRKEQIEGVAAPSANDPPKTCTVLSGIAISSPAYDEALQRARTNDFQGTLRKASLFLLAGDANQALPLARQSSNMARLLGGDDNANAANELLARCYKAQDGTLGRANAFVVVALEQTAAAKAAAPPPAPATSAATPTPPAAPAPPGGMP